MTADCDDRHMNIVHVLGKYRNNPYGGVLIDTTHNSGSYRELSPFILGPCCTYIPGVQSKNFENLWQFSKVYREHIDGLNIKPEWYIWRRKGWELARAVRYPMGKGAKPVFSLWDGKRLDYIQARKEVYARLYAENVERTDAFKKVKELYDAGHTIVFQEWDGYDHIVLKMSLKEVINDPSRIMGHSFVLAMMLQRELEECLNGITT